MKHNHTPKNATADEVLITDESANVKTEADTPGAPEPWRGTAAAAEYCGTSIPTFRRWLKLGLVTAKRTPTGELRFKLSELDKLIQ